MKKLLLIVFIFCMGLSPFAFAGEIVTTPQYIVLHDPTTNQCEKLDISLSWGTPLTARLDYNVVDSSGKVVEHRVVNLSGQDAIDLVEGFAATLNSRAEAIMWTDVRANYTTQANP